MDAGFDDQLNQRVVVYRSQRIGRIGLDVRVDEVTHIRFVGLNVQLFAGMPLDRCAGVTGKIDFVMLGCPHYTLKQIETVARLLRGKKIQDDVSFWVCTSATAKVLAERIGYVDIIEKAGGHVVVDTCIDEPCWIVYKDKVGMTDSPKCAYYRRFKEAIVARLKNCVDAAVKGEWK